MKPKHCPDCKKKVKKLNESCQGCGFKIVIEPDEDARKRYLRGPALGALFWTQAWALGGRLYIWFLLSLIPVVGVAALIILVIFGRRWSWERGGWGSWEEFQKRMRVMDGIGFIWISILVTLYFIARF